MKSLFRNTLAGVSLLIVVYFVWQWVFLKNTQKAPYCNLLNIRKGNCLLYLNVEHHGKKFLILSSYNTAEQRIVPEAWKYLAPFYFNEAMRYGFNISIDDSFYSELADINIFVDETIVAKYIDQPILSDSKMILYDNTINKQLSWEERKAIMYCLLKQGVNCCIGDESGDVYISRPTEP